MTLAREDLLLASLLSTPSAWRAYRESATFRAFIDLTVAHLPAVVEEFAKGALADEERMKAEVRLAERSIVPSVDARLLLGDFPPESPR